MKGLLPVLAATVALALSTNASAQPATKLTSGLDAETVKMLWCSAVFFEESYWYEEDNEWSTYYDDLSWSLEYRVSEFMDMAGLGEAEQDEIWDLYDTEAADIAENDEDRFLGMRNDCEDEYGDMVPRPKTK